MKTKTKIITLLTTFSCLFTLPQFAQTIVFDDNWADGDAVDGADPNDINWYNSTSNQSLEVGTGFLGVISGSSGRGVHGMFDPTSIAIGETLTLTAHFTTPDTIGTGRTASLRLAIMNSNEAPIATDISTSTDPIWDPISGYMIDFDVNTGEENISFRKRMEPSGTGANDRLLGTTSFFDPVGDGGDLYSFFDNTPYTVVFSLTRTGEDSLTLHGSLSINDNELSSFSAEDLSMIEAEFDFVALHSNSNSFGSSNTPDTPDNGVDYTNVSLVLEGSGTVTTWKGYELDTDGIVDTANWLGYLYVENDPWVYSFDADLWLYFPSEDSEENWAYIPR